MLCSRCIQLQIRKNQSNQWKSNDCTVHHRSIDGSHHECMLKSLSVNTPIQQNSLHFLTLRGPPQSLQCLTLWRHSCTSILILRILFSHQFIIHTIFYIVNILFIKIIFHLLSPYLLPLLIFCSPPQCPFTYFFPPLHYFYSLLGSGLIICFLPLICLLDPILHPYFLALKCHHLFVIIFLVLSFFQAF